MAQAPALPRGFELPLEPRLPRIGSVDAVALEERAATLAKRSIKKDSKLQAFELAVRMMDLTTLEGADTPGKVAALCSKAMRPDPSDPSVPSVAAVCVYPNLVPVAVARLRGSTVKVASVATAFPSGQSPLAVKLADVREAVALGADEIDMVIDRGAFLSGRYAKVYDEIVKVKEACGDAHLKVILETGELGTYDNVRRASLLAMAAGADFIKTSTGKVNPAATLPVTLCMLEAIRDVHEETGRVIGMKPAGGIRTAKQAVQYLVVAARDARPRVDDARSVPLRRLVAPQRRADADPQAEDRPVPVPRLLHVDTLTELERRARGRPGADRVGLRARARGARHRPAREALRPLHRRQVRQAEVRRVVRPSISPSTEEKLAEVAQANEKDVDLAVKAARAAFSDGWSKLRGVRAREVPLPDRPPHPGALARARGAREPRRRQADPREP